MKIKIDENLPEALIEGLAALGHNVDSVREEGIAGRDDATVWDAAQKDHRFLITQDLDFSDIRRFAPGTHCGILLVRMHSAGREALTKRITEVFASENTALWLGCFVILSDHKLRVQRPSV